jgi:hypothetical protein
LQHFLPVARLFLDVALARPGHVQRPTLALETRGDASKLEGLREIAIDFVGGAEDRRGGIRTVMLAKVNANLSIVKVRNQPDRSGI